MSKIEQAARQALEALREYRDTQMIAAPRKAIEALREALAEQVHTPYCKQAPMCKTPCGNSDCVEQAEQEPLMITPGGGAFPFAVIGELEQAEQEPVAIGTEWKPCMKLPVVVHVREQREGESHVSTREGITPVKPDDLIMRGVAGEEYPIGRELFNKTYTFDTAAPVQQAEQEPVAYLCPSFVDNFATGRYETCERTDYGAFPTYAAPVRTKDLTDEEIWEAAKTAKSNDLTDAFRAVIAADRRKNR